VESLGAAGFVPVMSGGLGGWDAARASPPEEPGEGSGDEEEEVGEGEEEESAKADSDSGSLWVCGI
jgi:hypothetical protein